MNIPEMIREAAAEMEKFRRGEDTTAYAIRATKAQGWRDAADFVEKELLTRVSAPGPVVVSEFGSPEDRVIYDRELRVDCPFGEVVIQPCPVRLPHSRRIESGTRLAIKTTPVGHPLVVAVDSHVVHIHATEGQ